MSRPFKSKDRGANNEESKARSDARGDLLLNLIGNGTRYELSVLTTKGYFGYPKTYHRTMIECNLTAF